MNMQLHLKMQQKNVCYKGMKWYKINSVLNICSYNNDPISMKKKKFLHQLNNYHLFRQPDTECELEGLTIY